MSLFGKPVNQVIKHPGSFKKAAHSAGMSTQEYASKVTSNPSKYSSTTVKRANLAKTLMRMRHK